MYDLIPIFLASSLRLAVPLLFLSMGELISERAGILNISLEGMMLVAACAGALGAWATGSPWLGLLAGIAAAILFSGVQAFLSVVVKANQIVVGLGLNIFALGITTLAARALIGGRSQAAIPGFAKSEVPILSKLPLIGPGLFGQVWMFHLTFVIILATWFLLKQTSFGLAVDASGSDPRAADKTGVDVARTRFVAVLWTGFCAGLAGTFLSIGDVNTFTEGMTNGAGFLALAAVIFGNWSVARTCAACLLFGFATALQYQLPAMGVDLPVAVLVMLPYVMALVAVTGLMGRQQPPAALSVPFYRGEK